MVFSTVGFAAATTYPAPFVEDGVANAAIVYGSHPLASDMVAVVNIQNSLNSYVLEGSVSTPVSADCEGETCVKLDKTNDKINLGDTTWPLGTSLDKDDLATTLADGTYTADDNDDFEYEQTITLGTQTFSYDRDSNYEDLIDADGRTPYLGFKWSDTNLVLNYTLDFLQDAESTVTSGDLDDFEGSDITLFGKAYYISDAKNGTNSGVFGKFTLLDAANSAVVNEGETVTLTVGSTTYEVSTTVFSASEAVLTINGETTDTLDEGQTYKLADGTFVGVKDIRYVSKETGVSQVEFSVGTGKIEMTSGEEVKINDDTIEGVYAYFHRGTASSDTQKLDKVVIEWKSEDESFLTTENELEMAGLGGLALEMSSWVRPTEEEILVENEGGVGTSTGSAGIALQVPVEDGDADINILYANATGSIKGIGKSTTERLATSARSEIIYYNKLGGSDYHKYLVVTYATTDEGESYLLSFNPNEDRDNGRNETTVKNEVTGVQIKDEQTTGTFRSGIGSASFTINSIGVNSTDEWLNITAGSNTNFNTIYSKGGLKVWLPVENSSIAASTTAFTRGHISTADAAVSTNTTGYNHDSYYLWMEGEDRDDNIAGGDYFYLTINDNSDEELEVTTVTGEDMFSEQETGDATKIYESYSKDETAARYLRYSDGNPDYVKVFYPAGTDGASESYAEVFLKSIGASMGENPNGIGAPILDTEVAEAAGKNLVVVGGSCVNTVAAELLGRSERFCGTEWTAATGIGADTFLIQTFARTGGNVATLVAGWGAIDTQNAATALTTQTVDTTAGKKYTGTVATSIEPVL
jgi:hypothetical protein